MGRVENHFARMEQRIIQKLTRGLDRAAKFTADKFQENITRVKEPFPYKGPHSTPGQYPFEETGQAAANVGHGVDGLESRAGVKGTFGGVLIPSSAKPGRPPGGMHLQTLRDSGRKHIDDTLVENIQAIAGEFIRGASR